MPFLTHGLRILVFIVTCSFTTYVFAESDESWEDVIARSKGTVVHWGAWGGSKVVNSYIEWAATRVKDLYDIELRHIKLDDTADIVRTVWAQKAVGRTVDGSVDVIWINGENFMTMKEAGLLYGPFMDELPSAKLIDPLEKPGTVVDFGVPTEGREAPWGITQLIFVHNANIDSPPPESVEGLLNYAKENPGRVTFPAPPDFTGTTFLKQLLLELAPDQAVFQKPTGEDFEEITKPLWLFIDEIKPFLWNEGKSFPHSADDLFSLFSSGDIDVAFSFGQVESRLAATGKTPKKVNEFSLKQGAISNVHFLAIPFNAPNRDAAQVVINFLMSPEAQAHKQDTKVWGEDTVLSMHKLSAEQRRLFDVLSKNAAFETRAETSRTSLDFHPSWVSQIEAAWNIRYGS